MTSQTKESPRPAGGEGDLRDADLRPAGGKGDLRPAGPAHTPRPADSAGDPHARDLRAADPHAVDLLAVARRAQGVDQAVFSRPDAVKLIAPAKVNLYLDIGQKRADGYHEVITVMHALLLHDVVRMRLDTAPPHPALPHAEGLTIDLVCCACEGLEPLAVAPEDNIVSKAIRRLAETLGRAQNETMTVHIEKHIPAQAGLGGGSSDAAAALVGAAQLWGVDVEDPRIADVARTLGADVAFFLHGGCALLSGVGDVFEHALTPLRTNVVLIRPEGGVSTAAAYRAFDQNPQRIPSATRDVARAARDARDVPLCNNLVAVSEALLPALADVSAWAHNHDDVQAALMSGSGSAVFALCSSLEAATRVATQARARGWWARSTSFGPARAAAVTPASAPAAPAAHT